jgi:hypothetical protein
VALVQVHPRSWYEGFSEMVVEDKTLDKSLKDGANQSTKISQKDKNKADNALTPFGQPGIQRTHSIYLSDSEKMKQRSKEILSTVEMFHKMHELGIKPNVVTFSAILNACRYVSILFLLSVTRCPVRILFLSDASK